MKNIVIATLSLSLLCIECQEEQIISYESGNYLQFEKSVSDSLTFSFIFYPDEEEHIISLPLDLIGFIPQTGLEYLMEVNRQYTTAVEGTHFELPEHFLFRGGHSMDTCFLTVKLTEEMKTTPVRLVLDLKDNGNFRAGQPENRTAVIWISNITSKPDWWTDDITKVYLGDYSDKKFELFIEVNHIADLTHASDSELRHYALQLKYHLQAEKTAGRTVTEVNGNEMTVKVLG